MAGSKCLGSGELRRPAGVDWLCLIVSLEVSRGFLCTYVPPRDPLTSVRGAKAERFHPPPPFPLAAGGDSNSLPAYL